MILDIETFADFFVEELKKALLIAWSNNMNYYYTLLNRPGLSITEFLAPQVVLGVFNKVGHLGYYNTYTSTSSTNAGVITVLILSMEDKNISTTRTIGHLNVYNYSDII